MSESTKAITGYQVCQEMVSVLLGEVRALKAAQMRRGREDLFHGECDRLAHACYGLQAEIRKTGEHADKAVNNLPPERQVELMLRMISELSPEHRMVVRIHLEELGAAIL